MYIDAIKDAEKLSNEQWLEAWILYTDLTQPFITRSAWIEILRSLVLKEVSKLSTDLAA